MFSNFKPAYALFVVAGLMGCSKSAETVDFYNHHQAETLAMVKKCQNDLSLSETGDCKNVRQVMYEHEMDARVEHSRQRVEESKELTELLAKGYSIERAAAEIEAKKAGAKPPAAPMTAVLPSTSRSEAAPAGVVAGPQLPSTQAGGAYMRVSPVPDSSPRAAVVETKLPNDAQAPDPKAAMATKRISEINAMLITPATQAMAKRYLESFVSFVSAGNLPQAIALFDGSADEASRMQVWMGAAKNSYSAEYSVPQFSSTGTLNAKGYAGSNPQGTLRLSVRLTSSTFSPPIEEWNVTLTLDENNRFKAVIR